LSSQEMEEINKIKPCDKVKVGERTGEVISVEPRATSSIIKVAFEDGLPKTFISPPTKIEKILSPLERLKESLFDPPFLFDLNFEAHRLSLAYGRSLYSSRRSRSYSSWDW